MSPNLAFIKDNGHTLEIETFFQLCIIELERIPSNTNRAIQGFKQAKINIDEMLDYDEKMQALSLFFETYHLFFEIPGTMILSGAVQGLIATTLSKNPTL